MDQFSLQPLPWLPVLETGHEEIDRQHRELIADANAVQDIVIQRGEWSDLTTAIGKMQRDRALHFADESKLLANSGFSDAHAHELEQLRSLLIDHFLRYDLQYKSHLMYYEPLAL